MFINIINTKINRTKLGKISRQLADSEYVESATLPHKITAAVRTKTPTVSRHPGGRRRWRD